MSILQYPASTLLKKCADVATADDVATVANLARTALAELESAKGLGLALSQVGFLWRAFLFCPGGLARSARLLINPSFIGNGVAPAPNGHEVEEGCLSVARGKYEAPLLRWRVIEATYGEILNWWKPGRERLADNGAFPVVCQMTGRDAQVFQHETDHTNGVLLGGADKEDGLSGELKEVRARITTHTDQLNALLLDGARGQTRLAFDAKPPNTGTTKGGKAKVDVNAAHAPVHKGTFTAKIDGRDVRIELRGDQAVGIVVDAGADYVRKTFSGAVDALLETLGSKTLARDVRWEKVEAVDFGNGKAAPPAPTSPLGVEVTVQNHILRVRPYEGRFEAVKIDLGNEGGDPGTEELIGHGYATEQVAKNAALDSVKHHGDAPEWKAIGAK